MEAFYDTKAQDLSPTPRRASPIIGLRNFNNSVKRALIEKHTPGDAAVLDLCGGRGGDLSKWAAARVHAYHLLDISRDSVDEARRRFASMRREGRLAIERTRFSHASCVNVYDSLPANTYDVVSCQFALHYVFDSYDRAFATLRGVANVLNVGGLFIGTIPRAAEINERARLYGNEFGNELYTIAFRDRAHAPRTYTFSLLDAIDGVNEHLVEWEQLVALADTMQLAIEEPLRSFETYAGFQRLTRDEREVASLYGTFVFRKTA